LARRLAHDQPMLQSIRNRLAHNRTKAPLFDAERFRGNIESAYLRMIDIHSRGEAPQSFAVEPAAD
jgi:predicted O-linked N-acetylglucosamine transferase (SPINDLY family)